jgi:hypothetical protein
MKCDVNIHYTFEDEKKNMSAMNAMGLENKISFLNSNKLLKDISLFKYIPLKSKITFEEIEFLCIKYRINHPDKRTIDDKLFRIGMGDDFCKEEVSSDLFKDLLKNSIIDLIRNNRFCGNVRVNFEIEILENLMKAGEFYLGQEFSTWIVEAISRDSYNLLKSSSMDMMKIKFPNIYRCIVDFYSNNIKDMNLDVFFRVSNEVNDLSDIIDNNFNYIKLKVFNKETSLDNTVDFFKIYPEEIIEYNIEFKQPIHTRGIFALSYLLKLKLETVPDFTFLGFNYKELGIESQDSFVIFLDRVVNTKDFLNIIDEVKYMSVKDICFKIFGSMGKSYQDEYRNCATPKFELNLAKVVLMNLCFVKLGYNKNLFLNIIKRINYKKIEGIHPFNEFVNLFLFMSRIYSQKRMVRIIGVPELIFIPDGLSVVNRKLYNIKRNIDSWQNDFSWIEIVSKIIIDKPKNIDELTDSIDDVYHQIMSNGKMVDLNQYNILAFDGKFCCGLKIYVPKNSWELIEIGRDLRNCIGNSVSNVKNNQMYVFTLIDGDSTKYCVGITNKGRILDIRGFANSPVDKKVFKKVRKFVNKNYCNYFDNWFVAMFKKIFS